MTTPKSFHTPCPYGNDNCPKCTKKERKQFKDTILAGILTLIALVLAFCAPLVVGIVVAAIFRA